MYLSENTPEAQAMRENVINLVKSQEEHNTTLAIQLMKGGGFVPETAVHLWRRAIEDTTLKKEVLQLFKNNLPEQAFDYIKLSFEYGENLPIFAMRYFDKLVQFEGFGWDDLTDHILPYAFENSSNMTIRVKDYFLQHPDTNKLKVMRAMITYSTQLDLQDLSLERLPEDIGELQELTYLSLYNTKISELPESFYTLSKLDYFNVYYTPLEKKADFLPTLKAKAPKMWAYYLSQNMNTNRIDEIEKICNEVLTVLPDHFDTFTSLISNLSNYKKYKTVTKYAERYAHHTTDDNYYGKMIADAWYEEMEYEKAADLHEKIAKSSAYSESYRDLCKSYLKINKTKNAIKTAKEAIAYDTTDMLNHASLIDAYIADKDFSKAYQAGKKALEEDGEKGGILRRMGIVCAALGKTNESDTFYEKLLKSRFNEEESLFARAQVYEERGDHKNAFKWYKKALDTGYIYSQEARLAMGYLHLKKKQYAQAECMFYEVAQRETENLVYDGYLGLACAGVLQNDIPFALESLAKAVQESATCRERAKTEPYLEAIRQEPLFQELVG